MQALMDNRAVSRARTKPVTGKNRILVLSQDCDIASSNETNIEVLVISPVPKRKQSRVIEKARSTKKLQLFIDDEAWLCDVDLISLVPKKCLEEEDLEVLGKVDSRTLDLLRTWRINRYAREPLPDGFNQDFVFGYLRIPETGFEAFLEQYREDILDLYVYVSPDSEEEVEQYLVSLTALLDHKCASDKASKIEEELWRHISNMHLDDNRLHMLQVDPSVIPDDFGATLDVVAYPKDFSMQDAFAMKRMTLDYLCYPDDVED